MGRSIMSSWLERVRQFERRGPPPAKRGVFRLLRLEEMEQRVVPVATLSVGNATFNLAAGAAGYQVTRSGDLTPSIDIGYTVTDGTAVAGTNYTSSAPTGVVHFNSEQTSVAIPLTILSNNFAELTRVFTVDLTGVIATFGPPATFAGQQSFAAGSGVRSVATADFNGDGRPDVVTANQSDTTVSVQLNTTPPGAVTPSFASQTSFATGSSPESVITADVNGDGRPDLIVANYNPRTLSVLLNTTAPGATTANFSTQQTFATGTDPTSVTAADLNGDGRPDLIATNTGDDTVSVFFNTTVPGAIVPSFATEQAFATGSQPLSVTAADVNGDGLRDLVVANSNASSVSVLLNSTAPGAVAPSFATQQTFVTENRPLSVTLADVNGDGRPDLITVSTASNAVSVLLNTSAPGAVVLSFGPEQPFATGGAPFQVAAADVNGDGRPDLFVANRVGTVSMLLNTTVPGATTPSFAPLQALAAGNGPYSVAASDVNGDGRPDIIVANKGDGTTSVMLNTTSHAEATPSGVPEPLFPQSATPATGLGAYSVAPADLNGDGRPDMAVANYADNTVSVLLNTTPPGATAPIFTTGVAFPVGNNPFSVVAGDVNGDGRPDLVVTNRSSSTVSVLINTTAAGSSIPIFAVQATFATGSTPTSASLADVNGDGLPDLLVANSISNTVSVLLNTTAPGGLVPTFATQQTFATGTSPRFVTSADVNGDGRLDLLVANNGSNSASVLLNTTAPGALIPSFAIQQSFAVGSNPLSVTATDINGDGLTDLITSNVNSNSVSVLLNTTAPGALTSSFAAQQSFATGGQPHTVTAADVNGDGRIDLLVASSAVSRATLLINTTVPGATTTSFTQQLFTTGSIPAALAVADINGDGRPDVLIANYVSNTVSVLLNTPTVLGITSATGTIDSAPLVQSIGLADGNPTMNATVNFTVFFSEAVSGVVAGNFALSGTATFGAGIGTPTTSDGGLTWNVPVTTSGGGTLGLSLNNRTGIVDSVGNQLYDTTSDDGSSFNPVDGPQYTILAATTTTVSSSLNPSVYGQTVTFTATMSDLNTSNGPPTGSVEFFDGSIDLGPGAALVGLGVSATSTFTLSTLTAGFHSITATYSATGSFVSSTSPAFSQTVTTAALTITAENKTKFVGAAVPTLTATYSGFVNGDNSASLTTQPTLATTATASSPGGTYPIFASGAVDPNYAFTYVAGTLTAITPTPPIGNPTFLLVGAGVGHTPEVKAYDAITGVLKFDFLAYDPSFTGGVFVASGDLNGDGYADIITGAGAGGGPHVKAFDGRTGAEVRSFYAYAPNFGGGVSVASGDVNGDGFADIITGAGAGGGPHVKVFSGVDGSLLASFYAYAPNFTGGVSVASGDLNGDGYSDIITGAGAGGGPHVKAFNGRTGAEVRSFYAYAPDFTGGVFVASGDLNGDGYADIITGAGAGGGPHVKAFDGRTGAEVRSFYAYAPDFTGGVSVASGDVNGDGVADIITGAGAGGGPHVKAFSGVDGSLLESFYAFAPDFGGGVYVG